MINNESVTFLCRLLEQLYSQNGNNNCLSEPSRVIYKQSITMASIRINALLGLLFTFGTLTIHSAETTPATGDPGVKKLRDVVIYKDDTFYSSFPSIVRRPNGELLVAFRRAPDRRQLGETHITHTDPNSYLELMRSRDSGENWTSPELIYANPFGGSQDPCMVELSDRSILCTSYGWAWLQPETAKHLKNLGMVTGFAFLGGYILRSEDGGKHWDPPIIPPSVPGANVLDIFGKPVSAYNRGAMCEGANGKLYWVVANSDVTHQEHTMTHLLISSDKGRTWEYSCPVAKDDKVAFSETSIYETPKHDLVAFMRTDNLNDHTAVARSTDGGKSFGPWQDAGFMGHPNYAMRLPDQRVLLVYGYRHAPFGIRARVLDAECTKLDGPEINLRVDGGSGDLGYPWATMLSKHHALVVYYFNDKDDGPRYIAGTFLEIE